MKYFTSPDLLWLVYHRVCLHSKIGLGACRVYRSRFRPLTITFRDWNEQVGNKKESESSATTNARDRRCVCLLASCQPRCFMFFSSFRTRDTDDSGMSISSLSIGRALSYYLAKNQLDRHSALGCHNRRRWAISDTSLSARPTESATKISTARENVIYVTVKARSGFETSVSTHAMQFRTDLCDTALRQV